jgi:hypothetical protein
MKKTENIYFKTVNVNLIINGEAVEYHTLEGYSDIDIKELFDLSEFYFGTLLEGVEGKFNSFNTYNWNAPLTVCGSYNENMDFMILNIHRGGDARGNYGQPLYTDNSDMIHDILTQQSELYIELSNGKTYSMYCENTEAFFNFDTFDPYWIKLDEPLTAEQFEEIEENMEEL